MLASPTNRFLSLRRHSIITLFGTILLFSFLCPSASRRRNSGFSSIGSLFENCIFRPPPSPTRSSTCDVFFNFHFQPIWRTRSKNDENDVIVESTSTFYTQLFDFCVNNNVTMVSSGWVGNEMPRKHWPCHQVSQKLLSDIKNLYTLWKKSASRMKGTNNVKSNKVNLPFPSRRSY